ncbi:MAG: DMT family transporter [Alphaproteobacteria bacterium]|nr:DMT family transporter [Alphaproteobacteria bacterium]
MTKQTAGVLFAFLGYALYICGDATVKAIGGGLDVFEIGFLKMLVASPVMLATRPGGEGWRAALHIRQPGLVALRALFATFSGIGVVIAFTTIPFAEAFALIFLAPILAALLSRLFLGEPLDARTLLAIALGLIGVLVAIRPGLRSLAFGHLAAFAAAFTVGASLMLLRRLSTTERRTTILGAVALVTLLVNGVLMLPSFRWPSGEQWLLILVGGGFDGVAQIALVQAARRALASRVAAAHYSQLVWAVLLGFVFFGERPDAWMLAGLATILLSGALTLLASRRP